MRPAGQSVPVLLLFLVTGCASSLDSATGSLSATDSGTIRFASAGTLVRAGDRLAPGPPLRLAGDLHLPAGPGPFPAVVLAHGCGGVRNAERGWVEPLNRAGYATFLLDNCVHLDATVGWSPTATEQARRNVLAQLAALLT